MSTPKQLSLSCPWQLVAVKVVDLLPQQRRQVAAAWRECRLLGGLQHECIVGVASFHAARVLRKRRVVEVV